MSLVLILAAFLVMALVIVTVSAMFEDHQDRSNLRLSVADGVAPLLHSINLDRCIGCEGCVDACPTNVLTLVHHKVVVKNFTDCVQCEQCSWACPTTALVMHREGTEPQALVVPELDEHFQTAVPGQYLIGEVAGKPLVKNAANLGRLVVEHMMADGLAPSQDSSTEVVDVVIVGSGPGGLSSALSCVRNGLSCVILEKEHTIASTVSRYPKGKSFMSEPADSRNLSYLPVFDAQKEELLAAWEEVIADVKLPVKKGEAVETVKRGDHGIFEVRTTVQSYKARRVILAIGLRGKPRLLAVPGANLPKVHSALEDPDAYGNKDVLVVGGGDSALEAAMSLSDAGSRAILSYRSKAFKRAKPANQKRIEEYASAGKVTVLMESNATGFDSSSVTIKLAGGEEKVFPNDQAFLLIGAEAPIGWLEKIGVNFVERPHSYQLGKIDELILKIIPDADDCPPEPRLAAARVRGQLAPSIEAVAKPRRHKRHKSVINVISNEWSNMVSTLQNAFNDPNQEGEQTTPMGSVASPDSEWDCATRVQGPSGPLLEMAQGRAPRKAPPKQPSTQVPRSTPPIAARKKPLPPPLPPAAQKNSQQSRLANGTARPMRPISPHTARPLPPPLPLQPPPIQASADLFDEFTVVDTPSYKQH